MRRTEREVINFETQFTEAKDTDKQNDAGRHTTSSQLQCELASLAILQLQATKMTTEFLPGPATTRKGKLRENSHDKLPE
ncbi:hypothetical protein LSTR_LSTR007207 [Laodelphax striatellus]|uniref:Uncharacterized protein n=1 Tax=Laodelphax striatellus TaxID=195883 RepID=A0A482XET4_LAOST|nr:hypothetical protein LSTR_LSTR007207 [Laodelphax striatellus]